MGAPRHVLRWLREGVRVEWLDGPPKPFHYGVTTFTPDEREWLTSERDRCLATGAWRRATCFDFVSRAFIVEHNGKRRLVIDFRHVNLHHVKRGCRFESLSRLRRMARRFDWVFSIDLKDAYHHIGVHPDDQDFFTFGIQTASGTEYFSASALSFGWCMSPWYFTQVMKPVVSYFRNPTVGQQIRFGQRETGPALGATLSVDDDGSDEPPALLGAGSSGTSDAAGSGSSSSSSNGSSSGSSSASPPSAAAHESAAALLAALEPSSAFLVSADEDGSEPSSVRLAALLATARADAAAAGLPPPTAPPPAFPPGLGLEPPLGAALASPVPPPPHVPPPTPDPALWAGASSELSCAVDIRRADGIARVQASYDALMAAGATRAQWLAAPSDDDALDALVAALPSGASDEELATALECVLRPRRSRPQQQPWRKPPPPPSAAMRALTPPRPPPPQPTRSAQRRERRRRGPRPPTAKPPPRRAAEVGCRVLPWLDDFAFFKQGSRQGAIAERDHIFATLVDLGLTRSPDKGQPEPSHFLEDHLGYGIDTARGLFLLTAKREAKLRRQAGGLLGHAARHRRHVRTRELAGFAGLAQASSLAVPLARFWLRSVYDDIVAGGQRWSGYTRLSRQAMADIAEWRRLRDSPHVGRAIWLAPDSAVGHVDAGPYGWGGQLDYQRLLPPAWGFWSPEVADLHITYRELRAVRLFIEHYVESLRGRRLLLYEDNQAVVAILTNLTTRSPLLMGELRALVELLAEADISVRATYIRSAANKVADYFSRIVQPHEYAVAADVFSRVAADWGECTVDAFASAATAMLHRYWAESHSDEGAEAVDAFAQQWEGERLWLHPPPHLLPQVAQFLREHAAVEAHVCVPLWPGEAWYGELLSICAERISFAAGSFERVAADAPERLESWPCTVFRVLPVA